jgi:hypothetical protein
VLEANTGMTTLISLVDIPGSGRIAENPRVNKVLLFRQSDALFSLSFLGIIPTASLPKTWCVASVTHFCDS